MEDNGLFYLLLGFLAVGIYFMPTFFAWIDRKRNTVAIFALNLFLGWTFFGWVVAMAWSLTKDRERGTKGRLNCGNLQIDSAQVVVRGVGLPCCPKKMPDVQIAYLCDRLTDLL
jgi:hypothetical protein